MSHIAFNLEGHDNKSFDFNGETIALFYELVKLSFVLSKELRHETEVLLVSPTKNCEKLIKEIHTKPPETLECKFTKPREFFSFLNHFFILVLILIG